MWLSRSCARSWRPSKAAGCRFPRSRASIGPSSRATCSASRRSMPIGAFPMRRSRPWTPISIATRRRSRSRWSIEEGRPIVVRSVRFEGFQVLPERRQRALPTHRPRRPEGTPLNRPAVRTGRETAAKRAARVRLPVCQGSASARRRPRPNAKSPSSTRRIRALPRCSVRSKSAATNRLPTMSSRGSSRSERASPIARAASRAHSVGCRRCRCSSSRTSNRAGRRRVPVQVPMRVTLTEDKHRQFTASAGFGSEEKARVGASWTHVNFLGDARQAGLEGKYSSLDRGCGWNSSSRISSSA